MPPKGKKGKKGRKKSPKKERPGETPEEAERRRLLPIKLYQAEERIALLSTRTAQQNASCSLQSSALAQAAEETDDLHMYLDTQMLHAARARARCTRMRKPPPPRHGCAKTARGSGAAAARKAAWRRLRSRVAVLSHARVSRLCAHASSGAAHSWLDSNRGRTAQQRRPAAPPSSA